MFRRSFRRGLTLGLLGGALMTAFRMVQARREPATPDAPAEWPPMAGTTPAVVPPARPAGTEVHTGDDAVEHFADASRQVPRPVSDWEPTAPLPSAEETTPLTPAAVAEKKPAKKRAAKLAAWVEPVEGACPDSHPIKGKLASSIFHVPGGLNYARTRPDRCYLDAAAAEADGLRSSKR